MSLAARSVADLERVKAEIESRFDVARGKAVIVNVIGAAGERPCVAAS